MVGQRAVRLSAPGVTVVSNATRWPRTVKLPRAPTWPLRRPVSIRLDVADRLPAAVRRRHVERAAAQGEHLEPHGEKLVDQQRRSGLDLGHAEAAIDAGRAAARARRIEIEHGAVENEARDRRAGCRVAVGVEGAAVQRQVGRVAQPDRRRDDVHVARRGHHGVARERLVGRAFDVQRRSKDGEQQAGERGENECCKARNDVLSSHDFDFARLDFAVVVGRHRSLPPKEATGLFPASVKARGPSLLLQTVAEECKLDCNAPLPATGTRRPRAFHSAMRRRGPVKPSSSRRATRASRMKAMSEPLWKPEKARADQTTLASFSTWMSSRTGKPLSRYDELHRYSVADPGEFWSALWDFAGVVGEKGSPPFLVDESRMPGARFFPDARLNFAENLLRKDGAGTALVFWGEDKVKRRMSWSELQRRGGTHGRGAARGGRRRRRPGRRHPAQHARGHRQRARGRLHRRGVVVLLARLRRPGRARSASARSSRRC